MRTNEDHIAGDPTTGDRGAVRGFYVPGIVVVILLVLLVLIVL